MSDQILQTLSGEAVDPTDVPYSAIFADIYSRSVTSRPIGYGMTPDQQQRGGRRVRRAARRVQRRGAWARRARPAAVDR
jgi:hypothetical protein